MNNHFYYSFVGAGWLALLVYWLVTAARSRKRPTGSGNRFAFIRLTLLLAVLVVLSRTKGNHSSLSYSNLVIHAALVRVLGLVLFGIGFIVAVWARHSIGSNWGMPMTQSKKPELISSGPYRLIRHPIYSGLLLALVGTCLSVSLYWVIVLAGVGSYFTYSAFQEEKYMLRKLPAAYAAYRLKTKMLIPFLY